MRYTLEDYKKAAEAVERRLSGFRPEIAMVLGSGLGDLAELAEEPVVIPYGEIPGFESSTAPGHKGHLVFGKLMGRPVAVMQGRLHAYEGYSFEEVCFPLRVLRLLGCEKLVITNASGGVNLEFQVGDICLITDHMKFFMDSPLRGQNIPEFGVRFPDSTHLYTPRLQEVARQTAKEQGISLVEGSLYVLPRALLRDPGGDPGHPDPGGRCGGHEHGARRSLPLPTRGWRCWGSRWWQTPRRGSPGRRFPSRRCWTPRRRPRSGFPG